LVVELNHLPSAIAGGFFMDIRLWTPGTEGGEARGAPLIDISDLEALKIICDID